MSNNQTDFNSYTGQGLNKSLEKASIYAFEALKAVANFVKHIIMTFLGK